MVSPAIVASAFLLAVSPAALPQLPETYKTVSRVTWVVKDLDRVAAAWEKLGFAPVQDLGEMELSQTEYRGKPVTGRIRVAACAFGDVQVNWVQPAGGSNAFTDFLAKHGDGVIGLMHRVPAAEALDAEVGRLGALGVRVLQRGAIETESGTIRYAMMDTEPQGKYVLGLIYLPPGVEGEATAPGNAARKVTQYAFVARDTRAVSAYWARLGFPEMSFTHGPLHKLVYRGKPGQFDQELGWQRHGKVPYEWIRPLKGPTVYEDHMKAHGEGVHHLAFNVEDMDKAIAEWTGKGYKVSQSGGWGEEGKPGSGRFAYIDTDAIGGLSIELLWNYR